MKNLTALTAAIALAGCSIAFQDRPTTGVATAASGCSSSSTWWLIDGAFTALAVAATGYGIYKSVGTNETKEGNVIGGAGGLAAIGFGASMGNGIRWSRECGRQGGVAVTAGR